MPFCRLHGGQGWDWGSRCQEQQCRGATAEMSSSHGGLACLPMGLPRSFLCMCKVQVGEIESEGNRGIPVPRADRHLLVGIAQGLAVIWGQSQPRLYPEERLPFPSHFLCGSGRSPGLTQLRETYPIFLYRSPPPSVSEGGERMQQSLILEPKASNMHIHPSKVNVSLGLPAPGFHPKLQAATTARNTTVVGLQVMLGKHQSRRHAFQRERSKTEAMPCQERGHCAP